MQLITFENERKSRGLPLTNIQECMEEKSILNIEVIRKNLTSEQKQTVASQNINADSLVAKLT